MIAMFIIHETDPQEYFEQMFEMRERVIDAGGTHKVVRQWSEKTNAPYYEYHFECENTSDLLGLTK